MRSPIAVVLVCLSGTVTLGCEGDSNSRFRAPTQPSALPELVPTAPVPIAPPEPRAITIGQVVEGRITLAAPAAGGGVCAREGFASGSSCLRFALTSSKRGVLVAELRWDPDHTGTLLALQFDDTEFGPKPPAWSPVVGRIDLRAGQRVVVTVLVAGSDWIPDDPFTLTTALE